MNNLNEPEYGYCMKCHVFVRAREHLYCGPGPGIGGAMIYGVNGAVERREYISGERTYHCQKCWPEYSAYHIVEK